MVTLEIRLLTGRYAAASVTRPEKAEWPPHPARVYSALTAALHDDPEPSQDEVRALEWLAEIGAPEIFASEMSPRELGNVFVPTNDQKALADIDDHIERLTIAEEAFARAEVKPRGKAEKALEKARSTLAARSLTTAEADGKGTPSNAAELLDRRLKPQPRRFPVAIPEDDVVHLCWGVLPPPGIFEALDRVAARVARLGHSSSLVSVRVVEGSMPVGERKRWVPDERGDAFLRVPLSGQLTRLREAHERHRQVEQRILPADPVPYLEVGSVLVERPVSSTSFAASSQEWIVFEVVAPSSGERRRLLHLSLAQQVARALRGTLHRHIDLSQAPVSLSGHGFAGGPAEVPHLAYVPLADVGHPHASGSILGIALVPPRAFGTRARDLLLEAIYRAETEAAAAEGGPRRPESRRLRLTMGRNGVLHLRRLREPSPLRTLAPTTWTRPSIRWCTATAVALGRNPGNLGSRDPGTAAKAVAAAERTVAADCVNLGLPEPVAVWIHRRSLLEGAPPAHRFMPFPDEGEGPRRVCVHAEVLFPEPIKGPLILGAGRFLGVGLCAPRRETP